MLLIFGIAALLQSVFLPGAIILRASAPRMRGAASVVFYTFALSLVCNYCLVMLLTIAGAYTSSILRSIFVAEIVLLLVLLRKRGGGSVRDMIESPQTISGYSLDVIKLCYWVGLFLISVWTLSRAGNIFGGHDPIVSWNAWAVRYASGEIPGTYNYPHLLPILMSIPYVFMGNTSLEFFPYINCLCFLPTVFFATYSLIDEGEPVPAIFSGIILLLWLWYPQSYSRETGLADFPVLAMGAIALCCIIQWEKRQNTEEGRWYLLCSGFLVAGAAVTKQSGLVLLVFYPFILGELLRKRKEHISLLRYFVFPVCIACIIALPWYVFTWIGIADGTASSETGWVTGGIHEGRSYIARSLRAAQFWPYIFLCALAALPGMLVPQRRLITFLGLFFVMIWAALLSYDARNAAFGIPFLAFSIGTWVSHMPPESLQKIRGVLGNFGCSCIRYAQKATMGICFVVLLSTSALLLFSATTEHFLARQQYKKSLWRGAGKYINSIILQRFEDDKNSILIHTNGLMAYAPGIDRARLRHMYPLSVDTIKKLAGTSCSLYILVPPYASEQGDIATLERELILVAEDSRYKLYQYRPIR